VVSGGEAAGGVAGADGVGVAGAVEGVGVVEVGGVCDRPGSGASQSIVSAATAIPAADRFGRLTTGAIRLSMGNAR